MARRRHAWQLDGVEQQLSMGAACLLLRPGARVAPFRAQWLLGSVLPTRSSSARACMQPPPAAAPLAVISVPVAPEPSLGVGPGGVLSVVACGCGLLDFGKLSSKKLSRSCFTSRT